MGAGTIGDVLHRLTPRLLRLAVNLWPPFLGAGIRVAEIAPDWSHVRVELRMGLLNRNFVGSHFGGSLYAMTDAFYMIMLIKALGPDYLVWDQAAEIEYVKPGRGTVHAEFRLDPHHVQRLRAEAADGSKLIPEFPIDVTDSAGEIVARVRKKIYVRLKKDRRK